MSEDVNLTSVARPPSRGRGMTLTVPNDTRTATVVAVAGPASVDTASLTGWGSGVALLAAARYRLRIDTRAMASTHTAMVEVYAARRAPVSSASAAPNPVPDWLEHVIVTPAGQQITLTLTAPVVIGETVTIRRSYVDAAGIINTTAPAIAQRAIVTLEDAAVVPLAGRMIQWPLSSPAGTEYRVTLGGTSFVCETPAQAVTALNAAGYVATAEGDRIVWVRPALAGLVGAVLPLLVLETETFDSASQAVLPAAPVGVVAGMQVRNRTDGSSGTVLAVSGAVVSLTGALTGGVRNRFLRGDVLEFRAAGSAYVLTPEAWAPRQAGSQLTAPAPAIVGTALTDLTVWDGALLLLSEGGVTGSAVRDPKVLFRRSTRTLRADDPWSITEASGATASQWNSATRFLDGILLQGTPRLSMLRRTAPGPLGLSLRTLALIPTDTRIRAVPFNGTVLLASSSQVHLVQPGETGDTAQVLPIADDIGPYLASTGIEGMDVVPNAGVIVIRNGSEVGIGVAGERITWHFWTFGDEDVVDAVAIQGNLWLLLTNAAGARFVARLDLLERNQPHALDYATGGALPFTKVEGSPESELVTFFGQTGINREASLVVAPPIVRNRDTGLGDVVNRMTLRYVTARQTRTALLGVTVERDMQGSTSTAETMGNTRVPASSRWDNTVVEVRMRGPVHSAITSVDYDATYFARLRRG